MLISPEYQKQQQALHESKKINYGTTAKKYGETIAQMVEVMEVDSVLDYGCGHNRSLMETFKLDCPVKVQCYDPGVPSYSELPQSAQMVVCIDVI